MDNSNAKKRNKNKKKNGEPSKQAEKVPVPQRVAPEP
jgi:hypothetical protein